MSPSSSSPPSPPSIFSFYLFPLPFFYSPLHTHTPTHTHNIQALYTIENDNDIQCTCTVGQQSKYITLSLLSNTYSPLMNALSVGERWTFSEKNPLSGALGSRLTMEAPLFMSLPGNMVSGSRLEGSLVLWPGEAVGSSSISPSSTTFFAFVL